MKRFISSALLLAVMSNSVFAYGIQTTSPVTKNTVVSNQERAFSVLLSNYKRAVMVEGQPVGVAMEKFMVDAQAAQISVEDVKAYAIKKMSVENYKAFSKTVDKGLSTLNGKDISSEKLSRVIESLIEKEHRASAEWISCGAGLGIGVPLVVAGIITGIVALAMKRVETSEVEKRYIDARKKELDSYTKLEQGRQDNIIKYESDISAFQKQIEELNRKINSGVYGSLEREKFAQEINTLNIAISDANAAISQLENDQPQLYESYENNIATLLELEKNEIKATAEKRERDEESKKILLGVSALSIPMGTVFVLGGAKRCE